MSCQESHSGGFTTLELVVVIVITSVLIAIAVPRIMDDSDARLSTGARMICSDIATVRNLAVATGATMEMTFIANSYSVRNVNTGGQVTGNGRFPVSSLSSDLKVAINTPGKIKFNSLGEPSSDSLSVLTINLVSNPGRTKEIKIERETGYAKVQ